MNLTRYSRRNEQSLQPTVTDEQSIMGKNRIARLIKSKNFSNEVEV